MFQKINRYFNRLKRESVNSINRNDPKLTDSKLTETTFWHVSKINRFLTDSKLTEKIDFWPNTVLKVLNSASSVDL